MGDIRGEKLSFRKQDIAALETMPSAKTGAGLPSRATRRRGTVYLIARLVMTLMVLATVGLAALIYAIDGGMFDETLTGQAAKALNEALGPDYVAHVGSAGIRLGKDGHIAIEARDVTLAQAQSSEALVDAGTVQLSLSPLALLTGHLKITSVAVSTVHLDSAALNGSQSVDWNTIRIDDVPTYLETTYQKLDEALKVISAGGTRSLQINDTQISFLNAQNRLVTVAISSLNLLRNDANHISANGTVLVNNKPMQINIDMGMQDEKLSTGRVLVNGADLTPLTMAMNLAGMRRDGLFGTLSFEMALNRGLDGAAPALTLAAKTEKALIFVDGHGQELTSAFLNLLYNFDKKRFEVAPSEIRFEGTRVPFEAAIADRVTDAEGQQPGYSISVLASNGMANVTSTGEKPLPFDVSAEGDFLPADHNLTFRKLQVSTPGGALAGSVAIHFVGMSPEISFAAEAQSLTTDAIKQIWPYWIATKARRWVFENVFDGKITNASIAAFIPRDRMYLALGHMDLDDNQLKLSFDADDLRLNIPGDIPPLRDASGHLQLVGARVNVDIAKGNVFMETGRKVALEPSRFEIGQTHVRPLMADLELHLAGEADALAELANYKPIEGLKKTDFLPEDFSGSAKAAITARIGLVKEQTPPEPVWKGEVALNDISVNKPVSGRKITSLTGNLLLDADSAKLSGQGEIDGFDVKIAAVVPTNPQSETRRDISVSGTLDTKDLKALAPGLSDIVKGKIAAEMKQGDDEQQRIKLDLTSAALTVPWIGWSKGSGVPAKAALTLQSKDGLTQISELTLSGDGFGLAGKLDVGKQGLNSANFTSVKLSSADSFAMSIKKKNDDFRISVSGQSIDLRSLLGKMKTQAGSTTNDTSNLLVTADIDHVTGFHDESISNLKMEYGSNSGSLTRLSMTGVSDSGQAIVANFAADGDGKSVQLTAGDAGALARFGDVYKNMQNGLLNMRLKQTGTRSWIGTIDIRKFQLLNEDRLQTIVSTPAGENGKSLNQAVKQNIDVTSQKFARGFASLAIKNGVIKIDNGVVRGEQVGATFQGTVRDAAGNIDMTGTFMPAYGLNRLFAELPVIGLILGNGRDRGLLGITFKMSGPFDKPQLTINPLSLIAPGVFRSIFEFQ